jgi:DNA helicase-2/ATP-dependent DNA helicase PcrA
MRDSRDDPDAMAHIQNITGMLGKIRQVEDFIWPQSDDWLESVVPLADDPDLHEHLSAFRDLIRRWQEAAMLPVDQLILTVGADLFTNAADLATAYSIALYLRRAGATHPDWYLPDYTDELARVARNERRFLGLSDDDTGFDPDRHRGKVTVATMHSAKGLEWDRVYLLSVNNYDFPSAQPFDRYISEKWFVRDNLNLEAEALAQLQSALNDSPYGEGEASEEARIDYATERLRLLYVGITRARRELVITWNTGRKAEAQEAIPLVALRTFWEQRVPTK